ncbi:diverse immunoglobulin domain-containing protein 2.1 isoform X3 [Megalobrama amblycephala]|uniref:diverse immunoglobulin domain-containing protein 2.1 isoform X3 n=1 Tax=Megalobrama amblycephala TaxID=75352 RepID=UPI002013D15A|nr:diverse immunoglobulin domain-containing protein 2.1 isoform X3 [Megalobrama amblycephala]
MADKSNKDLLGLIFLCSLLKGGHTYLNMFRSDGENINLPCNNDHTYCTSTSWGYRKESSEAVVLFEKGIKKNDIKRRERLSLGSDCSLNIYKVTTEDYGVYTCRQYENTDTDISVYLHILHVSPSSTQTEIRPGRSFTLSCQLYIHYGYPCYNFFIKEGIELVWVNKAGEDLQSDSRYQISSSPHHCISTLTTTLLHEDDNTEWTCQVTDGTKVETSVRYTVTYSVNSSENKSLGGWSVRVIITIAEIAALTAPTVILLRIICERRAGEI